VNEKVEIMLVGGPKHGDRMQVERNTPDITFVTGPTCVCSFTSDGPPPSTGRIDFVAGQHRYRRMLEHPFVFEHESLWNTNVERAAKRLDEKLARLGDEHNIIKKQRYAAEEREERVLRDLERAWHERDKLRFEHGV
jgi:hypothetical protein